MHDKIVRPRVTLLKPRIGRHRSLVPRWSCSRRLRTGRRLLAEQRRLYQRNAAWFFYFCPFPTMMRFVGVRGIAHDRTGSRDCSEGHNGE